MQLPPIVDGGITPYNNPALIAALSRVTDTQEAALLDGLLALIDAFQDEAADLGFPVKWLTR